MLTGKYERFQAVLVSNLRAWWSNVTAVLAIPTGVTPVGWRGETKWKSSLDLRGAKSGILSLSSKWDLLPTALHKCLFSVLYSSASCKTGCTCGRLKSTGHFFFCLLYLTLHTRPDQVLISQQLRRLLFHRIRHSPLSYGGNLYSNSLLHQGSRTS